jgi:hypothetical protein
MLTPFLTPPREGGIEAAGKRSQAARSTRSALISPRGWRKRP